MTTRSGYLFFPDVATERERIADKFELILGNQARILADREYRLVTSPAVGLALPFISGSGMLPLGILLTLWMQGAFTASCAGCGGKVLLLFLGGSILTGNNQWWGLCSGCRKSVVGEFPRDGGISFVARIQPALELKEAWSFATPSDDPIAESCGVATAGGGDPARQLRLAVRAHSRPDCARSLRWCLEQLASGESR